MFQTDWAPGKGIRETEFQRPFDKELGVVYIAWHRLPKLNLDALAVGGVIDQESLPSDMKDTSKLTA